MSIAQSGEQVDPHQSNIASIYDERGQNQASDVSPEGEQSTLIDGSATSGESQVFVIPASEIAEQKLMPASWDGPTGTSKARTLVKAMNNARKMGFIKELSAVTLTQDQMSHWNEMGFVTGEESVLWARFGFRPEQAMEWRNASIVSYEAFNYSRLGASPALVKIARRNHPSNNAPSDALIAAYVETQKEFGTAIPFATPDKVLAMTSVWWDWNTDKAVALDDGGYSHAEADRAHDAGQGSTVNSIKQFANRQRALYSESDAEYDLPDGGKGSARSLEGSAWADHLPSLPVE